MNVKRFYTVSGHSTFADMALLLTRVVAGLAFTMHGWGKIQNPFGWMGPEALVPGVFQALAAISEFGGGLAWILGLLTPLASLGIAFTMAVAFSFHAFMRGDPFVSMTGGPSSQKGHRAAAPRSRSPRERSAPLVVRGPSNRRP